MNEFFLDQNVVEMRLMIELKLIKSSTRALVFIEQKFVLASSYLTFLKL